MCWRSRRLRKVVERAPVPPRVQTALSPPRLRRIGIVRPLFSSPEKPARTKLLRLLPPAILAVQDAFHIGKARGVIEAVAGDVTFSLNIGAAVKTSLDAARTRLFDLIKGIENDRGVTFELGREVGTTPTQLDTRLIALIEDTAGELGIATRRMPTVGHDAAMFVRAGIPSAVILVRNANGSHNSDEALDREDFAGGVHVLGRAMHRLANAR